MKPLLPTPNLVNPQDDANIDNLTFTYNGPTLPLVDQTGNGLGNFVAVSAYDDTAEGAFAATNPRAVDGVIDSNVTSTIVPTGEEIPGPIGTPEPATLALAGLGLPMIGLARYFRRKQEAAPAV